MNEVLHLLWIHFGLQAKTNKKKIIIQDVFEIENRFLQRFVILEEHVKILLAYNSFVCNKNLGRLNSIHVNLNWVFNLIVDNLSKGMVYKNRISSLKDKHGLLGAC